MPMRCRWPPENSCGKPSRVVGRETDELEQLGDPLARGRRRSSAPERLGDRRADGAAAGRATPADPGTRSASRDAACAARCGRGPISSSPSNLIEPDVGSISRSRQRPTVVLPLPDSPTRPSVSPASSVNDTSETACTLRVSTWNPLGERTSNVLTRSSTDQDRRRDIRPDTRTSSVGANAGRLDGRRTAAARAARRARLDRVRAARRERAARRRPQHVRRRAGDREQPVVPVRGIDAQQALRVRMRGWSNRASTSVRSTARPAYITCTRSAMRAITPRSCVIITIAVCSLALDPLITSRICACTVTSRAVVGSSAISTSGSLAIAIAIITRWRMPPENSCGYCRARCSGCGMPTTSSSSTACAAAAFARCPRATGSSRRSGSPIRAPG